MDYRRDGWRFCIDASQNLSPHAEPFMQVQDTFDSLPDQPRVASRCTAFPTATQSRCTKRDTSEVTVLFTVLSSRMN